MIFKIFGKSSKVNIQNGGAYTPFLRSEENVHILPLFHSS